MTVSEVMTRNVCAVPGDMAVDDARALMRRKGIHHVAVTRNAELVGIASSRDLTRRRRSSARVTVADVMTRHVLTVDPAATLARAAYLMRGRSIGCLIVRKAGRIEGIVTTSDLLNELGTWRYGRSRAATAIHHRTAHRHRARGDGVW